MITKVLSSVLILYFDGSYKIPQEESKAVSSTNKFFIAQQKSLVSNNYQTKSLPIASCSAAFALVNEHSTSINTENYIFMGSRCFSPKILSDNEQEFPFTSTRSEYEGLILGLKKLLIQLAKTSFKNHYKLNDNGVINLIIRGDCKTVIQQLNKSSIPRKLIAEFTTVQNLLNQLETIYTVRLDKAELIPRTENILTDTLCRAAIDVTKERIMNLFWNIYNESKDAQQNLHSVWNLLTNSSSASFFTRYERLKLLYLFAIYAKKYELHDSLSNYGSALCMESQALAIKYKKRFITSELSELDENSLKTLFYLKGIQFQIHALQQMSKSKKVKDKAKIEKYLFKLEQNLLRKLGGDFHDSNFDDLLNFESEKVFLSSLDYMGMESKGIFTNSSTMKSIQNWKYKAAISLRIDGDNILRALHNDYNIDLFSELGLWTDDTST